ncbi:hypothetical protein EV356DRAFT_509190 [Viridothelium virens]|uniref:Uncharacterized protein n=1 Tax=Viridothelium virens TaxID=1048519 RepID=A0A6A6GX10_VIRVR|nr:hypothetical protein EV356DRAFT_509190 [Viridothelium virens]
MGRTGQAHSRKVPVVMQDLQIDNSCKTQLSQPPSQKMSSSDSNVSNRTVYKLRTPKPAKSATSYTVPSTSRGELLIAIHSKEEKKRRKVYQIDSSALPSPFLDPKLAEILKRRRGDGGRV